jgi:hypothetical protein
MTELKPIDRTDRGRSRLDAALGIYRDTILPEAQNPERQILYWIDHSREMTVDQFRCFAIQNGGTVIGYLQYSYFSEERIFFFEYLCIRDKRSSGMSPSKALTSIEKFLAENYDPGFVIVFEVAQTQGPDGTWRPDKKLITYFARLGFRTIDYGYRYPILQSYEGSVSYPADLMVRLPNGKKAVSGTEMRTVLRCIYFKHYLRWDRPFLTAQSFDERERMINELYSQQIERIGDTDHFGTSGDDRRGGLTKFEQYQTRIGALIDKVFGPKLPRLITVIAVLLCTQWALHNQWLLIPFVLCASALYCIAEDTEASRKLFVVILSKLKFSRQQ